MVNLEVKGTLAKLLATEDLVIEHRNVSTASFDVDRRVLTLPRWENATSEVIDLLISHEVGHALFTPCDDWNEIAQVPSVYINIAEDARIEKLMKTRFAGLPKTFFNGYKKLHEDDFFGIADEDINEMSFADRVNLHFKVGNFINVPFFSEEETDVVGEIQSADTFVEMVYAAEKLYLLCEKQKEEKQKESAPTQNNNQEQSQSEQQGNDGQSGQNQSDGGDIDDTLEGPDEQGEGDDSGEQQSGEGETVEKVTDGGGERAANDPDVKTVSNLSENIEDLAKKGSNCYGEPVYLEVPDADLKRICVDNSEIHNYIQTTWQKEIQSCVEEGQRTAAELDHSWFEPCRIRYREFRKEIASEVNYMVKEFECKKSAASYARASTSRTGVLDCTKLHTYKYNEDLFKKVTTVPNGKNHGLVFILDWSGSMCHIIEDTVRQLLSVVMFCDKVNIPFDVYIFTNEWERPTYAINENEGQFYLDETFRLLNILTSRTSRKELRKQMETLHMLASMFTFSYGNHVPPKVSLSGTPLNESIMTLKTLLPDFKKRTGVEKAHVMILTDGESVQSRFVRTSYYGDEERKGLCRIHVNGNYYIRNRKTGVVRWLGTDHNSYTPLAKYLIDDLKDMFPDSTFTGFRILESSNGYFIRQATNYSSELIAEWKKNKTLTLDTFGYDRYFIISNGQLQQSSQFEVDDDASKAKIKSAFAKSLKSKKVNKKILSDFIDLIA